MAEEMLLLEGNFCHRELQLRDPEEWVVAEAACAARSGENFPVHAAVAGAENFAVARNGEDTAIARGALGDPAKAGQQVDVIALIDREARIGATGLEARVGGVARGADTGLAAESIDFEAGIVGEDQAGDEAAIVLRFEPGVAGEGELVLGGCRDLFEAGRRIDSESTFGGGDGEVA